MYNETYVKNTKRRGTMLDISYYEKTDEIIAAGYDLAGEKEAYMSIIT